MSIPYIVRNQILAAAVLASAAPEAAAREVSLRRDIERLTAEAEDAARERLLIERAVEVSLRAVHTAPDVASLLDAHPHIAPFVPPSV